MLSANLDRAQTARAIDAGAAGALSTRPPTSTRSSMASGAYARAKPCSPATRSSSCSASPAAAASRSAKPSAIASLTPREREVLKALAAGLDGQTIADRLGISIRTERNHVARILSKLGVHTQLQAVLYALRYGLMDRAMRAARPRRCSAGRRARRWGN